MPVFTPYPGYWYGAYGRPRPLAARVPLLVGAPAALTLGGLGTGPGLIETGLGFFAHGNPVGGPSQGFRGVSAASFPASAIILGPGAPLFAEWTGLAGVPLGGAGRGGVPIR